MLDFEKEDNSEISELKESIADVKVKRIIDTLIKDVFIDLINNSLDKIKGDYYLNLLCGHFNIPEGIYKIRKDLNFKSVMMLMNTSTNTCLFTWDPKNNKYLKLKTLFKYVLADYFYGKHLSETKISIWLEEKYRSRF